jgi:hypothetical protein
VLGDTVGNIGVPGLTFFSSTTLPAQHHWNSWQAYSTQAKTCRASPFYRLPKIITFWPCKFPHAHAVLRTSRTTFHIYCTYAVLPFGFPCRRFAKPGVSVNQFRSSRTSWQSMNVCMFVRISLHAGRFVFLQIATRQPLSLLRSSGLLGLRQSQCSRRKA